MVNEEVENILAEIRERVRSQVLPTPVIVSSPQEDVAEESAATGVAAREAVETSATEALARIDSYLTITSRAWDRLPPLVSNRTGSSARLELWVKRQFKRTTRWFTWEQINFNASVDHALRDTVQALAGYEQALERLRSETEAQRATLEQNQAALNTQRQEIQAQRQEVQAQRQEVQAQRQDLQAGLQAQRTEIEAQRATQVAAQRKELDARLAALAQEMHERFEHLQEEQQVCFKQLSLEATEAAVLEDRARRKTEILLEEFKHRVSELEK